MDVLALSVTLAAIVITILYYNGFFGKLGKDEEGEEDDDKNKEVDLNDPKVLIGKISDVIKLTTEVTADMPWYKFYSAFAAYLHFKIELALAEPEFRNSMFLENKAVPNKKELEQLVEFLEYSDWAYENEYFVLRDKLKTMKYHLVRHVTAVEPGRVGHFLAIHEEQKIAMISCKGTSSMADVMTDALASTVQIQLPDAYGKDCPSTIACHEGILTAATQLADDIQILLEKLFLPQQYKIIVCGHSLGAGVACLSSVLLKSRIPELRKDENGQKLQVWAYATPACLDCKAAVACTKFMTSIVNNTDCVPRMSMVNVQTLNQFIVKVNKRLEELGQSPDSLEGAHRFVEDLSKVDDELLFKPEEIREFMTKERSADAINSQGLWLYVPGRVAVVWNTTTAVQMKEFEEKLQEAKGNGEDPLPAKPKNFDIRFGTGDMTMLRRLEIAPTMVDDHLTAAYRESLQAVLKKAS